MTTEQIHELRSHDESRRLAASDGVDIRGAFAPETVLVDVRSNVSKLLRSFRGG
jgi:hypothetical protein